jgi:hypothetical protein
MLTQIEIGKAAQLLIGRYGARKAHIAAAFRCLELTTSGQISAARHWQAIAEAIQTRQPRASDERPLRLLRQVC